MSNWLYMSLQVNAKFHLTVLRSKLHYKIRNVVIANDRETNIGIIEFNIIQFKNNYVFSNWFELGPGFNLYLGSGHNWLGSQSGPGILTLLVAITTAWVPSIRIMWTYVVVILRRHPVLVSDPYPILQLWYLMW